MKKQQILTSFYFTELNGLASMSVFSHKFSNCSAHRHDFFEFEFITEGEICAIINGKTYSAKEGDAVFVTPSDVHSYTGDRQIKTITVHFNPEAIDPSFNLFDLPSGVIACQEELKSEFYHLFDESTDIKLLSNLALKTLLERILILYLRAINSSKVTSALSGIPAVFSYITKNFSQQISLDEICTHCGYSPSYFCRIFKKTTGLTFVQYLTKIRLEHARRLLFTTDLSAVQICYECGFGSIRNFNRAFKKAFGMSPLEYKVKIRPY